MNLADEIKQSFIEESEELLSSLEDLLLDLEDDPSDKEKLDAVFRVMHTIKGSAGMVGETEIESFAHSAEDMFDRIRKGVLEFDKNVAGISLEARDIILDMMEGGSGDIQNRIRSVQERIGNSGEQVVKPSEQTESPSDLKVKTWRITFVPSENTFIRGGNPLLLLKELSAMGEFSSECHWEKLPTMGQLSVDICYLSWDVLLTTSKSEDDIKDVFLFVESDSSVTVNEIDEQDELKLGEILVERGAVSSQALSEVLDERKKLGEVLVEKDIVRPETVKTALLEQEHLKKVRQKQPASQNIRVNTGKLDNMVNLVGELVTTQAQLAQIAGKAGDMQLSYVAEALQRLVEELRDTALGIRMTPVGNTFGRFRRLVRDLSNELGKEIRMEARGEDTELDKTVIDKLNDPLVHLIRNAVDHGIEMPEIRKKNGKPSEGTILLEAKQAGGQVQIIIEDDGGGINKDAVMKKAINLGLIPADAELTEEEIYGLIFRNGFSTAGTVSNVSGRGVGMDVVKKEIEYLQGSVSVQSKPGEFSRVTVSLPLTLAIIDGLLVRINNDSYILPLSLVEACMDFDYSFQGEAGHRNILGYREQFIPYVSLRKYLKYPDTQAESEQVVVLLGDNGRYGLVVDEVVGDHQTVIKNLGKVFKDAREFSGATILGDGKIALILNVGALPSLWTE
ncbi:MAG: chemotaxis protein CheA [Spirochaetales bacterium]|nr:chemotaxis protein CheA [Spirochaetales bacterium]